MRQHLWLLSVCAWLFACEQPAGVEISRTAAPLQSSSGYGDTWSRHVHRHHGPPTCETSVPPADVCGWNRYDLGLSGTPASFVFFDVRAPGVAYATSAGLLWRSTDAGETWSPRADVGPTLRVLSAFGDDPNDLIATTTNGMEMSEDAGASWYRLALSGLPVDVLEIPAAQPQRVYSALEDGPLLMSVDGGYHFRSASPNYPRGRTTGLSVDPRDPLKLVAAVLFFVPDTDALNGQGALLTSADAGLTWQTVYEPGSEVNAVARCAHDPDVLIAATRLGVARSEDNGASWTLTRVGAVANGIAEIAIDPGDCDDYYATEAQAGPRHTRDGGKTFGEPLVQGLELTKTGAFPGTLNIDPADPTHLFLSTHGGFYTSHDSGEHWTLLPAMLHMDVTDLAISASAPARAWLATWGQGVWTRDNSAAPWTRVPLARLPRDYTTMIGLDAVRGRVIVGASPAVFSQDGVDFRELPVPGPLYAAVFHPSDASIIYLATQVYGMFKSDDAGETWQTCNGSIEPWSNYVGYTIDVRGLAMNPAQPEQLFATTNGSGIYRTDDGAQTWTQVLSTTEPAGCLVLVPGTPARLYACMSGVMASEDGGQTWAQMNEGLASLESYQLLYDAVSDTLFLSNGSGVYRRGAGASSWQLLDEACATPARGIALMEDNGQRYLLVGAEHGVQRHAL